MKIGVFTDSYRPYVSGVVRSIETFSRELRRLGHEIYLFAPHYPQTKGEKEVNVFRFPSFHTPFNPEFYIALPFPRRVVRYASGLGLDVIHVHSPFMLGQAGARLARSLDLPLVFTYHTLYDQYLHYAPLAGKLAKRGIIAYARNFCNRCDLVITPTGVIREMLFGYGVQKPVVAIPTGIYPERFRDGDPDFLNKNFGVPPDKRVLLFVGRIGKEKNLAFLMRAFALVSRQVDDAVLVLVGSGPEEAALRRMAYTLGVGDRVVFTGRLPPEVVAGAYAGAYLFAFPSVTETQGLVLVEAMAAGLPVVAQAAFGSLAMVQDGVTGYLCRGGEEEFAAKVLELLDDSDLHRRMAEAAAQWAWKLSAEKMALRLEKAYLALVHGDHDRLLQMGEEW
ncbi:MAG: 1,2-diacylglycerol 3-alpha-glucosyltransferase [Thermacetogenium sp.]|jgi:glycosyltransferase involved in cell wall biosynthesis|uniref:GDP-mannose-dependent alpha-mannosyltransferase MgtA n=1 Tax=Thermacetogenium phaeum TaxID=85874 RepID=A0A124FK47_9THEO|nr:MAG: GDP-mannose-dependent alpha-mannosyltransferase MgtA [Thermacetogenium phaeum]MDN5365174.1 1,2-diacylglycerol 3-alpha-glucosyltransferase [Thermacetogenium sp.]